MGLSSKLRPALAGLVLCAGLAAVGGDAGSATSVALTAATAADPAAVPTVDLSGDPQFDSDSIADSSSKQPRWLSVPESRWVMSRGLGFAINNQLELNMGGYVPAPAGLDGMLRTTVGPAGGATTSAGSASTTWYPYKIGFAATYNAPAATVSGSDFFTDKNTVIRQLRVDADGPVDVTLSGTIPSGETASWDAANKALVFSGSRWGYTMTFGQGTGADAQSSTPVRLDEAATISGNTWTLVKRFNSGGDLFVSTGFSVAPDPGSVALARSQHGLSAPIGPQLTAQKTATDTLLRSVPAPQTFEIAGVNTVGTAGASVSAAQQRAVYYRAWAFLVQQLVEKFTADGYDFPQISCGKPVLVNFNPTYPPLATTCPWDSLFGMQLLAFVPQQADGAFTSLEGLLGKVIQNGSFTGEQLPSRMAQTAWILYKRTGDLDRLTRIYPLLRSFLFFMEDNPHWNLGGNPADEKDLEFVSSWLYDVEFAKKIAAAVGQSGDVTMWQQHASTQMTNLREWFFDEPDAIYQFLFTSTGEHFSPGRPANIPNAIISALAVPNLPQDIADRLTRYFLNRFDSPKGVVGLDTTKYPNTSFIARGLAAKAPGPYAHQFVNAGIRDAVFPNNFGENLVTGDGLARVDGIAASIFSAAQVIDFTLLNNGFNYANGEDFGIDISPGNAGIYSGFESADTAVSADIGTADPLGGISGVSGICCGLTGPETTVHSGETRSGTRALLYSGHASGSGSSHHAYTRVFDLTSPITVTPSTVLQYSILPQSSATTTSPVVGDNSSYVAVDVVFSDGTALRNLNAKDQRGNTMHPTNQGGTLQLDKWNRVISKIGAVADGKTIVRIGIGYDRPNAPQGGYRGFIDDLSIANGPTG